MCYDMRICDAKNVLSATVTGRLVELGQPVPMWQPWIPYECSQTATRLSKSTPTNDSGPFGIAQGRPWHPGQTLRLELVRSTWGYCLAAAGVPVFCG